MIYLKKCFYSLLIGTLLFPLTLLSQYQFSGKIDPTNCRSGEKIEFCRTHHVMNKLKSNPILGHITTFGGHPVISQAGLTTLKITLRDKLYEKAKISESKFRARLKHKEIVEIRGKGLMLALILKSNQLAKDLVIKCLEKGLILFWLLYESKAVRITPPLNISENEIEIACDIILKTLEEISN